MLAFIINYLWLFWPYLIIVNIGNFITRQILEYNKMQSTSEEEVEPFEKEETTGEVKERNKRRNNSESNKPSNDKGENSIDGIQNYNYKPLRNQPFDTVDVNNDGVTKIFDIKPNMSKFFVVNEDIFFDINPIVQEDEYRGYQLYKVMKSPEAIPEMDGQDEELTEDDLTEDLLVTEEATQNGVIINSNVYLTTDQWHTIMPVDKDIFSCTVCQIQCDSATVSAHIRSAPHARKLDGHRPLKRFDISIIRKINENLHCAVCNSLYPIKNYLEHENSKSHEQTLLTAINKVTDLLQDGYNQKSTLSFNTNNIQAPNNAPNTWLNFSNVSRKDTYSPRNAAYSPGNAAYSPGNATIRPVNATYSPGNAAYSPGTAVSPRIDNSHRFESFPPGYTNISRGDFSSENRVGKEVESKTFHVGNISDIKVYEEEEDREQYTPPIEGISYASMASKPRVHVPKFLKIDLGTKEVRVTYESWHMITQIDCNQLFCMVCKKYVLVRHKNQHCLADEHRVLLAKCNVVGAFEDYLIRDVNEKLYHCGHCNNLQVKNDIQPHIEKYHPMKNGSIKDINPLQMFPQTNRPQTTNFNAINIEEAMKKLDIFGEFVFSPFGTEMVVPNLGCHTLMIWDGKYVCALCNVVIQGDVKSHVFEPAHMQYIIMTPFIRPFQSNLTRAIRGSLHCLLCNVLLSVRAIYTHNVSAPHTAKLARALGMRRSERPTQEVKYQCDNHSEYRNALDRFLSTLPPDSREALNKLTITNHKGEPVQLNNPDSIHSPNASSVSKSGSPSEVSKHPKEGTPLYQIPSLNNNAVDARSYAPLPSPLLPGQMLTVSMIESGLPGVRTGSPVAPFRPPLQLQITGPMELKLNHGIGRIPVSPIRRKEDVEVANDLLSLYKQSPVRAKAPEKKTIETAVEVREENVGNIKDGVKKENVGAVVEENTEGKFDKKKKTGKKVSVDNPPSSSEDEELPFKLDEPVLLKIKTSYFRVTNTAYQTLVHLSNGSRYCFVCSQNLEYSDLQKHVNGREHIDNMSKNKFLCNFNGQLLRQMYLMFHCALCNVTMSRRDIKQHLVWPTHVDRHAIACKKLSKKILKEVLRQGVKELLVETQKEFPFVNISEPSVNIVTYVQSVKEDFVDLVEERKLVKKSQMIILKGTMLKISFPAWHGIVTTKSGTKCILCQRELTQDELYHHIDSKYHNVSLGKPFLKQYYPALARQINENTINCVICNLELSADESLVAEHISGRKHDKNYSAIVERTSQADCYSDCYKYPITL